jgi:hypothetical protein
MDKRITSAVEIASAAALVIGAAMVAGAAGWIVGGMLGMVFAWRAGL